MNRIIWDHECTLKPQSFEETIGFSIDSPYNICFKRFLSDDIVPLHYAKTMEILFCDNLIGNIFIEDTTYELGGKQVFVIPPNIVHSNEVRICDGEMIVLKISISDLSHYFHLDHYFKLCDCTIEQMSQFIPNYQECRKYVEYMVENDEDLAQCLSYLLRLLLFFTKHKDSKRSYSSDSNLNNAGMQALISWTEAHYHEKIKLDDVAALFGYSKYYFCSLFKSLTGITYFNYLNSVRISNACLQLKDGKSVQDVSIACGFESCSYFIQIFKRIHHITPRQYVERSNTIFLEPK